MRKLGIVGMYSSLSYMVRKIFT